jgi:type IV secretory pathway component VirB8
LFSSFIEHKQFAGAISEQRAVNPPNHHQKNTRTLGIRIASTNRQWMTLMGIVFMSLADAKRRGRTKVAPLFEARGQQNGF